MNNTTLLMTKEYWENSLLSTARYYGDITYNGRKYVIVDKYGRDLWECTAIAKREGRQKAIDPG